jgi:sensor histidine kinase YesM
MEGGTLRIEVANCLVAADANEGLSGANAGVGLDNVRHRLAAVFGKRATLTAGEAGGRFVATIRIPEAQRAN